VPKKYSPKDVNVLIRMASQIHSQNEAISDKEFSKTDIVEIAEAADIPSSAIIQALDYFDTHEKKQWTPDNEDIVHLSRFFKNQDSEIDLEVIANDFRRHFNIQGTATQFGSTFEWSGSPSKTQMVHVSISQSKQVTKVELFVDYSKLGNRIKIAGSVLGFILLAILSSTMNLDSISNWVPAFINFSGAGLGYIFSSKLFGMYINRRKSNAKRLLDTFSANIQAEVNGFILDEEDISKSN